MFGRTENRRRGNQDLTQVFSRVFKYVGILLVAFIWISELPAASFDCKKASTYVEKRICEDATPLTHGLSLLDDDMGRAYQTILQRIDNPAAVKTAQRQWLKTRDVCKDAGCIKSAYEKRFITLHAPTKRPLKIIPSNGKTVESHLFPSEADKLKVIRDVLRSHTLRPSHSFYSSRPEAPYCTQFMKDFLSGNVKAVEPDVRAETGYDPALAKMRSCDGVELKETNVKNPRQFYDHIGTAGQPPYRYYHIDIDGNPENGKEDLLYHETAAPYYNPKAHVGHTAYSWIDLDACEFKGGAPMSNIFAHQSNPGDYYRFSFIAKYRKKYLALSVYPNTKDTKISNYNFSMMELTQSSLPTWVCRWREPIIETVPVRKVNKTLPVTDKRGAQ